MNTKRDIARCPFFQTNSTSLRGPKARGNPVVFRIRRTIMDFLEIANARQSCRSYDETRAVEHEKLRPKKRKELGELVRFVG